MRAFIFAILGLIIGAGAGIYGFTTFILPPTDVYARAAAFNGDKDYFFQSASEVYPTRTVSRAVGGQPLPTLDGQLDGFTYEYEGKIRTIADLYTDMPTSGIVIIHRGNIIHESYGRGADAGTRFTTNSVVKSITSTLVGVAVQDGLIASVDDQLTTYLPELVGTAYDGVTIKNALQMSSGIRYDPQLWEGKNTDTVKFLTDSAATGKRPAFDIARTFKREHAPGTTFNYNTAESQILLELVRRVTKMDAADYLQQKIWQPLGMDHDAGWILDRAGNKGAEIGGVLFNASLRDWARFGLFIEQGGVWDGKQILPRDWVDRATVSDEPHIMPGQVHPHSKRRGYAWHWWTFADGTFTAVGSNGQRIYIDRANDIVIAKSSVWDAGYVAAFENQGFAMYKALAEWLSRPQEQL